MKSYSLSHLANPCIVREFTSIVRVDLCTTARLLAYLGELDERRLYLGEAHSSMFDYCVGKLNMSEDMAWMRIRVARTARLFPAIFPALADGRLNLTAVLLLTPKLAPENAGELLTAAAGKSKDELKRLLAERFPQADLPTLLEPVAATGSDGDQAMGCATSQLGLDPVGPLLSSATSVSTEPVPLRARLEPRSAGRFALQVTLDQETHELLRYVQSLLGHSVPPGDIAEVLKRSLRELAQKLEKQKFAKTALARPRRGSSNPRYIPAEVRRAVWERDGGQCTFMGPHGKRCDARASLEFDHVDLVARGGRSTVAGVRLLCRAHNQYTAQLAYGAEFMRGKREHARVRAAEAKAKRATEQQAKAAAAAAKARAERSCMTAPVDSPDNAGCPAGTTHGQPARSAHGS